MPPWRSLAAALLMVMVAAAPQAAPFPTSDLERPVAGAPTTPAPTATAAGQASSPLPPDQPIPPPLLEAFVDGVVRQAMADHHLAGAAVSVVQDGQTTLRKGYGFARLSPYRPVDPDRTLFRIGSISKTFTWLLVLGEIEAGRMRLDGPINRYLPDTLHIPDQGFREPIRVRDLMNHTAGFESRSVGQLVERDFARVRPLDEYLREERPARVRPTESEFSYSNYGVALAGAAVAEIEGRPFETLVETQITGPLNMDRTTFREPHPAVKGRSAPMSAVLTADIADGYRSAGDGFRLRPYEYIEQVAPAAGASSTAGDMARYMSMLLGGGGIDGTRIHGPIAQRILGERLATPAPGVRFWRGGFSEYALPGDLIGVGHDGDTLSFHSAMILVPRLRLGVFVVTNTDTGEALTQRLAARIVEHFYAPAPAPPRAGSLSLIARRSAFEGDYRSNRRAYHGLEGFIERLTTLARVSVTGDGRIEVAQGAATQRLTSIGDPSGAVFSDEDGYRRAAFRFSGGRAIRFAMAEDSSTYERAPWWDENRTLLAATVAVGLASLAALAAMASHRRRDFRESSSQGRAGFIQATQALLWLVAFGLFAAWRPGADDPAAFMYDWPDTRLVVASSCALVASVMILPSLALLPLVWRGGRRLDSWSVLGKLRYTLTALIFLFYALLLALWGALEPWSA